MQEQTSELSQLKVTFEEKEKELAKLKEEAESFKEKLNEATKEISTVRMFSI